MRNVLFSFQKTVVHLIPEVVCNFTHPMINVKNSQFRHYVLINSNWKNLNKRICFTAVFIIIIINNFLINFILVIKIKIRLFIEKINLLFNFIIKYLQNKLIQNIILLYKNLFYISSILNT